MQRNNSTNSQQITPFFFEQHQVRVITDDNGEYWFVAKDIAEILGYRDAPTLTRRLDEDEFYLHTFRVGGRKLALISESGLYSSILGSNKQEAKFFKRWVTHDVLPSIRKNGEYISKPKLSIKDEIWLLKETAKILRLSESSIQNGIAAIYEAHGATQTYLPSYSSTPLTKALGDLLRENNTGLSAMRVNPILIKLGILEIKERRASHGQTKYFKSLTEKGEEYGENDKARQNTHETQPRYYVNKFPELLDLILENIDILKVGHLEVVQ